MSAKITACFDQLKKHLRETALLESMEGLLGWDERTYLPPAAGEYRAEQMTYLAGLIHEKRTLPQLGEWLQILTQAPDMQDQHSPFATTVRQLQREYNKRIKLPQRLVEELTHASVVGQQTWVKARQENNFADFAPCLEKLFALKREQAAAFGYTSHIYDPLLDDYEPNATTAEVTTVLADLRERLVPLVQAIRESGRKPQKEILHRAFPIAEQEKFGNAAAAAIGFDFERGRLDVTHHPFCSSMGPHDCRITTRYDAQFFPSAFFGILHEAGHGIYDQGLDTAWHGLPPGSYLSLGIHESQSRMWENLIGRSREFWERFYPQLQAAFPSVANVSLNDFYFAINNVEPSLIRVEADEATYNLHIIVRFELEQALLTQELAVKDLPGAWREKYKNYLGIEPPTDANGCLQDVHWSAALIGYFPTYSLGNLYAAQFYETANTQLGGIASLVKQGDFTPLKAWLNREIHMRGQCYSAAELVQLVTGKSLTAEPFMRLLSGKLNELYGL
jgi:carboxypeptidase Taq